MVAGTQASNTFKTDSLGWQLRKSAQQVQEWFDYQFSRVDVEGPDLPQWKWPEMPARVLFWILVVAFGLWLSWMLYRVALKYWQQRQDWVTNRPTVKSVPTSDLRSALEWWREANALAQAGQYREACRALYLAALQKLHEQKVLPYDPSRTDGEYLSALTAQPQPRPYELLIRTHERTEFGSAPASAETYQRCRKAYREIDQP
ncbi:MAG TPA: DUF4129 domain-containing protein [Trichocoleus sp.]